MGRRENSLRILALALVLASCAPAEGKDRWDARFENLCGEPVHVMVNGDGRPFKDFSVGAGDVKLVMNAFDESAKRHSISVDDGDHRYIDIGAPSDAIPPKSHDTYIVVCD